VSAAPRHEARPTGDGVEHVFVAEQFYAPTVLTGVTPAMEVMRDETFAPVVAICRVRDEEESVTLANQSPFGLNASIWTADLARGLKLAERLETGCVCINDCILNAGDPSFRSAASSRAASAPPRRYRRDPRLHSPLFRADRSLQALP
jgi:acyl-CoA reductase-like NAD-dependent aldehyde dehydrogenase